MEYKFEELESAPLIIDAVYKGGTQKNLGAEPINKLLPKMQNQGGFRITYREDESDKPAYVVLYTTSNEIEWPDYLDLESGVFRYYGDNRKPGKSLHDTRKKGNLLLKNIFNWLNLGGEYLKNIPPILIFKKADVGRDVKFLGLAVPGNRNISPDRDLFTIWRTQNDNRFQNYEAYFTILDTKDEEISKKWLKMLVENHKESLQIAPDCWKLFVRKGRQGIKALTSEGVSQIRTKGQQLPVSDEDKHIIGMIKEYYKEDAFGFEYCAVEIIKKMDFNFINFEVTRPWKDGGRDAIGEYKIGLENNSLKIDCALEAKCYDLNHGVGVKMTSRLISRIRHRQFGVFVTTSFFNNTAYEEIIEDKHPVLMISAIDICNILKRNGINEENIYAWLEDISKRSLR